MQKHSKKWREVERLLAVSGHGHGCVCLFSFIILSKEKENVFCDFSSLVQKKDLSLSQKYSKQNWEYDTAQE